MLKITINDKLTGETKELNIKRTLSGDYMLREHPEIDIMVLPEKNKVLVVPKDMQTEPVYRLQDDLFKYLVSKGVILPDTVVGGNIYGSLEGQYIPQPPGGENPVQAVVYSLANFIEDQRPAYTYHQEYEKQREKELLNPDEEDATELGEVPQEPFKGSVPKYGFPSRGIYRYNY